MKHIPSVSRRAISKIWLKQARAWRKRLTKKDGLRHFKAPIYEVTFDVVLPKEAPQTFSAMKKKTGVSACALNGEAET